MLHLCVRHVAAAGGFRPSRSVGHLHGNGPFAFPSLRSLPFLHLYRGDAAPFPFPSQWDTRHPSLQRDTGKTTRKRLHSRVDHCLWQVDKGLQATDRLDTHYDAPTYLRVPTAWHSRGLFVRGLAAADKAEWGRRRPD